MSGSRIGIIFGWDLIAIKDRPDLRFQCRAPYSNENHPFTSFRNTIVTSMKDPWGQHDVTITVSLGEIPLDDLLDIAKISQSLDILGDKHLRLNDVNDLFHPEIKLPAVLLRRHLLGKFRAIMRSVRLKTKPFPSHTEILAWKAPRD